MKLTHFWIETPIKILVPTDVPSSLSTFINDKKIICHHLFMIPSCQQDILCGWKMLIDLIENKQKKWGLIKMNHLGNSHF